MTVKLSGRCLCGAVSFRAEAVAPEVVACHCTMCQKQVMGPYMVVDCLPLSLAVEGESSVTYYKSSEWARRGFCKECGSALFWRSLDGSNLDAVSAGALDDKSGLRLDREVFIEEKPGYYGFADGAKRMTGTEFFAYLSAFSKSG